MPNRLTHGEPSLTVYEVTPGLTLTVYRIVRSEHPDDPVLANSLRSHYEMGVEPRGPIRPAVLHMGISTYLDIEPARRTAQRWPRFGEYIAHLALKDGNGFNWAMTGHPKHITVWGDPLKLAAAVVDIVEV